MSDQNTVEKALVANLSAANKALDTYLESVIDPKTYHALHETNLTAQAALDAFHAKTGDDDELPPVVVEHYRDGLARMLRNANPRFE